MCFSNHICYWLESENKGPIKQYVTRKGNSENVKKQFSVFINFVFVFCFCFLFLLLRKEKLMFESKGKLLNTLFCLMTFENQSLKVLGIIWLGSGGEGSEKCHVQAALVIRGRHVSSKYREYWNREFWESIIGDC